MIRNFLLLLFLFLWVFGTITARQKNPSRADVANAIEAKDWSAAYRTFDLLYQEAARLRQRDSITQLLPLYGEIALAQKGADVVRDSIQSYIRKASGVDSSVKTVCQLYMDAAEFYSNLGQSQWGYDAEVKAMEVLMAQPTLDSALFAKLHYNMGVYAQRLGQVQLSQQHHQISLQIYESRPQTTAEDLYMGYNAMGACMWYSSQYDSASIYYNKSLAALDRMPPDLVNTHYRRGIVLNNLAGLYAQLGRLTEAIEAQQESTRLTQGFVQSPEEHPKKKSAQAWVYQGIDNLAGLYKQVGDFHKAGDLLQYSYSLKTRTLQEGHFDIFTSQVLLGQYYTDIREYETGIHWLEKALQNIDEQDGEYLYWEGDACRSMAKALSALGRKQEASAFYNRAQFLFEKSYQGEYDNIYLDFLREASLFWAGNGELARAQQTADRSYQYMLRVQGPYSLGTFYELLNLAEIQSSAGQYTSSLQYANRALNVLEQHIVRADNRLDSVRMQMYQPLAILLREQARYELAPTRDSALLTDISGRLQRAIDILEQRKVVVDDAESINIIMSENASLLEFARKIEMELYQLSGRQAYLDRFINLHESFLYSRIRSRLDKADAIRFANLPDSVIRAEQTLKAALSQTLESGDSASYARYTSAVDQWNRHLEQIQMRYPDYYQMRYARITRSAPDLDAQLAEGQTVLRYYQVGEKWFVLVLSKGSRQLVPLQAPALEQRVEELYQMNRADSVPSSLLNSLYRDLWSPAEPFVRGSKLVIIPDGILFSLSFEMLTGDSISSYAALRNISLLAKYAISYHYSLYLLGRQANEEPRAANFVAFVPGFDQSGKERYRQRQKDSLALDNQYLRLLAQPNTRALARQLGGALGGRTYTDEESTVEEFKKTADGHHLVLIGTHAEYDNMNPDRSRLIFTKDPAGSDSNALYLEDIYGCRVQSDLTILTACETGKPGYQDGEGMVSLAHAFNYAGSRNILMGLWKIDEKTSSSITGRMVEYLRQGLDAAEALRQAKLDYLATAPSRTLAPVYWAGLVMMGDAPVIEFEQANSWPVWMLWTGAAVILLLALIALGWWRRQAR